MTQNQFMYIKNQDVYNVNNIFKLHIIKIFLPFLYHLAVKKKEKEKENYTNYDTYW